MTFGRALLTTVQHAILPWRSVAQCRSWRAAAWGVVAVSACSPVGTDDVGPSSVSLPGDAGPAGAGPALCGRDGEPCCGPPLRECAPGGTCSGGTGLCEASPASSAGRRLCRSASDCPATEACCDAGFVSTCVPLAPNAACPTIDLQIDPDVAFPASVETRSIAPLSCESGCLNTTGRHRLLRVGARVINRGDADLLIGAPGAPGVRVAPGTITGGDQRPVSCSEYSYAEGLVRYELIGADDIVYSSLDARLSPGCKDTSGGPRDCNFLRLPSGIYSNEMGCLQLPIDGVAPGDYKLRFTIDPNDRVAEKDESNNTFESNITLARVDLLGECTPAAAEGYPPELDCGWTPALAAPCNPGAIVSLGCAMCVEDQDPFLRVCAGSEACFDVDGIASNDDQANGDRCPIVTFTCPAAGAFSSFVGYYFPPGTCDVTRLVP